MMTPKGIQKKLNRWATQKSKMAAIFKMAAKLTSENIGGNKTTSCKSWYKHQIWQGGSQDLTKDTELIGHSKIQDGRHFKDGHQTHLPK